MTIVLSPFVKEVTKVPGEIQFLIIKFVIHDYLENTDFKWYHKAKTQPLYPTPVHFAKPLHYLTALMSLDTLLDDILAEAIKEFTFESSIFENKQLKKFVDFVLSKSIKIHLQTYIHVKLDKTGVELLNHGCSKYTCVIGRCLGEIADRSIFKFITFLSLELYAFHDLFKRTENLKLLKRLKCLRISTRTSVMGLLNEEIVQKLITWRCDCDCDSDGNFECEYVGHINKRVVFSIDLDYVNTPSMFVSKLADLTRSRAFEIEYNEIFAFLSDDDEDMRLFQLLDLENPLDNQGLEDLARISKYFVRVLSKDPFRYQYCTPDDPPHPDFIAKKYSSDFIDLKIQPPSQFSFKHAGPLKNVILYQSFISYECLNSLPDTLLSLTMDDTFLKYADQFHEIRLPIHLVSFSLSGGLNSRIIKTLSHIVNGDQLGELSQVDFSFTDDEYCIYLEEITENLFFQLGKFLHELPTLNFLWMTFSKINMSKKMVEQLSLHTLDYNLTGFSFLTFCSDFAFPT
ncbi:unnamed protein product [Ambrosiozyma monospora]|uniref:Unnamed protein product n=1 Tax=Ambrosiozyma monospora TaxID=43982 RepID=A0ACB5T5L4_AMBMO|nr:unnamed protein product [Ambrosiozyma monospora]